MECGQVTKGFGSYAKNDLDLMQEEMGGKDNFARKWNDKSHVTGASRPAAAYRMGLTGGGCGARGQIHCCGNDEGPCKLTKDQGWKSKAESQRCSGSERMPLRAVIP